MEVSIMDRIKKIPINYDSNDRIFNSSTDHIKDAFMRNPVASVNDCTGFVQRVPYNKYEAEALESINDCPVSSEQDDNLKS